MVTKLLLSDGEIAERVRALVPGVAFTIWSLWHLENVLIAPHVGGDTELFPKLAAALVAAQLSRFLTGAPLEHRITDLYRVPDSKELRRACQRRTASA